jgi:hypothetical protein
LELQKFEWSLSTAQQRLQTSMHTEENGGQFHGAAAGSRGNYAVISTYSGWALSEVGSGLPL